jgi:hypothetical protein
MALANDRAEVGEWKELGGVKEVQHGSVAFTAAPTELSEFCGVFFSGLAVIVPWPQT